MGNAKILSRRPGKSPFFHFFVLKYGKGVEYFFANNFRDGGAPFTTHLPTKFQPSSSKLALTPLICRLFSNLDPIVNKILVSR